MHRGSLRWADGYAEPAAIAGIGIVDRKAVLCGVVAARARGARIVRAATAVGDGERARLAQEFDNLLGRQHPL